MTNTKLDKWLEAKGWSQRKLAESLGISESSVHRYIHKGQVPESPIMRRWLDLARGGISASDFYAPVKVSRR